MPVYTYRCRECGQELEARQKFSDDPLEACPQCGAAAGLFRVIQAAGVVFKGSGFYINDSRGSKDSITAPAKSKDATSDAKPESSGTNGTKTESTPAAPTTTKADT